MRENPRASSVVMLATVATVVPTHDLAQGVVVGVLSGVFFAGKVSRLCRITSTLSSAEGTRTYTVEGQVFFAPAGDFSDAIDVLEPVDGIVIDVSAAHFWDISAVGALDRLVLKARRHGHALEVVGLNAASATLVDRFAVHRRDPDAVSASLH